MSVANRPVQRPLSPHLQVYKPQLTSMLSLLHRDGFPHWLIATLWIANGILLAGQLRAWWVPYLLRAEPTRAARYRTMFGKTHAFLPVRNGMVPNTAHVLLHVCTVLILAAVYAM